MDRWKGKVAVVTGASSGIGEAICQQLVAAGVTVVGLARRQEVLEVVAKTLQAEGAFHPLKTDVSKEDEVLSAFQWISTNLGPIHILINSAGFNRNNNLVNGDASRWKEVFDTNVLGLCMTTREAIKSMRLNNVVGHIIHINSIVGHSVLNIPTINVYPASKFAVTALTETLRQELNWIGSKIKITSLSPGFVATNFANAAGCRPATNPMNPTKPIPKLDAKDISDGVMYALATPPHVQVHELTIKTIGEP